MAIAAARRNSGSLSRQSLSFRARILLILVVVIDRKPKETADDDDEDQDDKNDDLKTRFALSR